MYDAPACGAGREGRRRRRESALNCRKGGCACTRYITPRTECLAPIQASSCTLLARDAAANPSSRARWCTQTMGGLALALALLLASAGE